MRVIGLIRGCGFAKRYEPRQLMSQDSYRHMPCVILAGGQSRRMNGQDKAKAVIGGVRLIDHIYKAVMPQAGRVFISGRHDYGLGAEVIADLAQGPKGPAAGLYACWDYFSAAAQELSHGFFTVPVDGPNIPVDLMQRLYSPNHSAVAADNRRTHPVYAWWRAADLTAFWQANLHEENPSLRFAAKSCNAKPIVWEGADPFPNINTAEDLERYKRGR